MKKFLYCFLRVDILFYVVLSVIYLGIIAAFIWIHFATPGKRKPTSNKDLKITSEYIKINYEEF